MENDAWWSYYLVWNCSMERISQSNIYKRQISCCFFSCFMFFISGAFSLFFNFSISSLFMMEPISQFRNSSFRSWRRICLGFISLMSSWIVYLINDLGAVFFGLKINTQSNFLRSPNEQSKEEKKTWNHKQTLECILTRTPRSSATNIRFAHLIRHPILVSEF